MRKLNGNGNGSDGHDSAHGMWIPLNDLLGGMLTDLGHRSEKAGELMSALHNFELAVQATPDDPLAWYNYGDALLGLNRVEEALPALERAVELAPSHDLYHYDLGLALYSLRRFGEAADQFLFVTSSDPKLARAHSHLGLSALTNLALCYGEQGNWKKAAKTLKPAESLATNILYNLGRFHLQNNSHANAARLFKAGAIMAPTDEGLLHGAASALMNMGRYHEAELYFAQAVKAKASCVDAWYERGVNLSRMKKKKLARSCLLQVLRRKPKYKEAYFQLARLDALERKKDSAFLNLQRAVDRGFKTIDRVRRERDFTCLRSDPRWKTLIQHVKDLT